MEETNGVKLALNNFSQVDEVNYNWNIPNYQLNAAYTENLKLKDDLECTLMLVPKKYIGFNKRSFIRSSANILFTKVPTDGRETWFSYSVRSDNNAPLACAKFHKAEMTTEPFVGNRNNLSVLSWKTFLNKDNSLNLNVKFLLNDIVNSSLNNEKGHSQLSKDFSYDDVKYPDITLISGNNEKLPANKAVLAGRSPVFANILTNEIDTYIIEESYSKDNVMAFLQFLYTGTISVDKFNDNLTELMELASKYEVSELTNLCQQHLLIDCKTIIADIFMKMGKMTGEEILKLDNFAEINRNVKSLYRYIKDVSVD